MCLYRQSPSHFSEEFQALNKNFLKNSFFCRLFFKIKELLFLKNWLVRQLFLMHLVLVNNQGTRADISDILYISESKDFFILKNLKTFSYISYKK